MENTTGQHGNAVSGSDRTALQRVDVESATNIVVDWMLQGASGAQILEAIAVKFPEMQPAELLTAAGNHFEKISNADPRLIRGWCFEATRDLYRRMIEIGDYANALRAVKQLRDFTK